MPETRQADYLLSFSDGSISIDFNKNANHTISLIRISFDGYGCCELKDSVAMNLIDSTKFDIACTGTELNHTVLSALVLKTIKVNSKLIWKEALTRYELLSIE